MSSSPKLNRCLLGKFPLNSKYPGETVCNVWKKDKRYCEEYYHKLFYSFVPRDDDLEYSLLNVDRYENLNNLK